MDDRLTRFKDASWLGNLESCIIGGAGGIGSWLTLLLARANFIPVVYDFDTLEVHNLGGQLFPSSGLGKLKTDVLAKMVKDFANIDISTYNEKYDEKSMADWYMFSAFDNMKARKDMFFNWKKLVNSSAENKHRMQILCIKGDDPSAISSYEGTHLFEDTDVQDAPCTMKQTSHAAAMIASFMVGYFTNHITNVRNGSVVRHVPYYHEYFIPLDLFS
jgi:hypothetical protein